MEVTSGLAGVNDTKLYYEVTGQGHPLVLIHGGLMDSRMWDRQFSLFAEHYQVIRYDLRGYARSEAPKGEFSHVEDLSCLLKFLRVGRAYVLGLSLGGMIAIDFTLEHPDIVGALLPVASAVNGYPYKDEEDFASRFEAIFKAAEEEGVDQAVALTMELPFFVPAVCDADTLLKMRMMVNENFETWSKHQGLYMWPSPPAMQRLSEIEIPTLVIVGDHDVTDIVGVADVLTSQIAGARKVVIHGAGHHVNMEQPEQFRRAVASLLKSL